MQRQTYIGLLIDQACDQYITHARLKTTGIYIYQE